MIGAIRTERSVLDQSEELLEELLDGLPEELPGELLVDAPTRQDCVGVI